MELKIFNKNIRLIGATGAKLDALVHLTAVGGLAIVQQTRDARHMDRLLKVLPKGYRQEGFKVWVSTFSPIRWNGNGEIGLLKPEAKGFVDFDVAKAEANPFWTLAAAKEKTATELSPAALIAMLDKQIKYAGEADAEGNVVGKDGAVHKKIAGNVVAFRDFVAKVKAAAEAAMPAPEAAPKGDAVLMRDGAAIGVA